MEPARAVTHPVLRSCLYEGAVEHRRYVPVEHHFQYRLFMLYLDLGEIDRVFRRRWLWSARRPAVAWFRRADYLGDPRRPLRECVWDLVWEAGAWRGSRGAVRLLTHVRYLGVWFNPISLYYCFDEGEELRAVVAEVTNTPWGERCAYVLDVDRGREAAGARGVFRKRMHVSPFLPMDIEYQWRLGAPAADLGVEIRCRRAGTTVLDARLRLARRELTAASLRRTLCRYPPMSLAVLRGIYWQALRLRLRGVPYHPHPNAGGADVRACPGAAAEGKR